MCCNCKYSDKKLLVERVFLACACLCFLPYKTKTAYPLDRLFVVRETGLEPVRCEPHAPQTCASASSATLAYQTPLLQCGYEYITH